jgi:uncharacterized protein YkwD
MMAPMKPAALLLALVAGVACESSTRASHEPAPAAAVSAGDSLRVAPPPPRAPDSAAVPEALRGLVEAHNARRAAHCAPPLAWSTAVAAVAQRHADQLRAGGCNLIHSSGPYGENLFGASPAGGATAAAVVDSWYGEVARYSFARPGFSMETGHFTQVVWRGTTRLGCGVARCADSEVWVCNYDGPGNVEGQFPDNVRPAGCQ